jgi:hypothetical protein
MTAIVVQASPQSKKMLASISAEYSKQNISQFSLPYIVENSYYH